MFEKLVKEIENLDDIDKLILGLYFVDQCTEKEISEILNIPEPSIKNTIQNIIEKAKQINTIAV